jgi:hypothetical protein
MSKKCVIKNKLVALKFCRYDRKTIAFCFTPTSFYFILKTKFYTLQ